MSRATDSRKVNRLTLAGLLTAAMLVLGYFESLLPSVGIPGIKPGLSNSVLIFAVYMLDVPTAYVMMTLKVVLFGLMFGGVTAIVYAFAGGLASLTVMCLLSRIRRLPPVAVSMAGGLFHNAAQVGVAALILHTPVQILYYLAVLAATGLGCGMMTGMIATAVMKHLKKMAPPALSGDERKHIRLRIAAAVLTVAAAAFACMMILKHRTPAAVVDPADTTEVQMLSPDALKEWLEAP